MLFVCACVFACLSVCVCVCRVITALESVLSGVGGVTRLDFWTLCSMDQMVHYTPVWQSNCSLYSAHKHTCPHKHICAHRSAHTSAWPHTHKQFLSVCQNRTFLFRRTGFPRYTHLPDRHCSQMKHTHSLLFFICPCIVLFSFSMSHKMYKSPIFYFSLSLGNCL